MRLLGHRDFNMTLHYSDVTLQTVRKEFFHAINQLENTYGNASQSYKSEELENIITHYTTFFQSPEFQDTQFHS